MAVPAKAKKQRMSEIRLAPRDATKVERVDKKETRAQAIAENAYRKGAARARGRAAIQEGQGRALAPRKGLVDAAAEKLAGVFKKKGRA